MEKNKNYYKEKGAKIIEIANSIADKFKTSEKTEKEKIMESLRQAEKEWKDKEKYFQSVTEPDLVDHAIYELEASKIKYMYLLKKVKEIK
ncbi:DUF2508 family protein [Clostridium cochlearium]|uniref:DUF2508 family protein n=1 Tax=Clostridium cochlearium TaxID=1494 RepID=UPI0017F803BB|nr:DUF2508 family protein [Clostridium cochlearium]NMA58853.1 DUF2508 family protein [Clostridium cochlearium]